MDAFGREPGRRCCEERTDNAPANGFDPSLLASVTAVSGRNLGKARCEIGWSWNPPPLADYDLWYAVSGRGAMRLAGTDHEIGRNGCFLVHPGDRPNARQDPDNRLTVIYVHFRLKGLAPDDPRAERLLPPRHVWVNDPYAFESLLNRLLELEHRDEPWKEAEFDLIVKQLLLHLHRSARAPGSADETEHRHRRLIARVIRWIRESEGARIRRDELARRAELSPEYLSLLFRKYQGTSLKRFITSVRLERAAHLLAETTMNVSQVAEALGYANVYLFSKQFKERYGVPPSAYKWRHEPPKSHRR